jgi:SAM-dependent methyltransferase
VTRPSPPVLHAEPARPLTAEQAKLEAQRIAFGPMLFHAVEALRSLGVLHRLWEHDATGLSLQELEVRSGVSSYGIQILCQAALTAGIIEQDAEHRLRLSKVGYFLLHDSMTKVNFDFVRDVCYPAMPALTQSIVESRPAGLPALGGRSTVYETLLQLRPQTLESWLRFDHFYSDQAFDAALAHVLKAAPKTLLDVGANTGRFAQRCLSADPGLELVLVDHPPQLAAAERALSSAGHRSRVRYEPCDLLELVRSSAALPGPVDVVWLSQVIDCLPPEAAVAVFDAARRALTPNGRVFVLEPCLDKQRYPAGTFCLAQTSLYFACVANGGSRMYDTHTLAEFFERAGLTLCARHDGLGVGHSLFELRAHATARAKV